MALGLFPVEPLCSSGPAGQSGARRVLGLGLQANKAIVGFVEQPQVQKTSGEGTAEQMKRLRAENVELKKELLRLQHLEDQVQLLSKENELLKEQNASLKQQTKVCQPHGGRLSIDLCETASQTSLDSHRCSDKEETECRLSAGAGDDFVNEDQGHVDFMTEGQGHTDSVKEHQRNIDFVKEGQGHTDLVKEGQGCSDFVKGGQGHADIVKEGDGHIDFAKAGQGHTECMKKSRRRTNVLLAKTVLTDSVTPEGATPFLSKSDQLERMAAPIPESTGARVCVGRMAADKERREREGRRAEGRLRRNLVTLSLVTRLLMGWRSHSGLASKSRFIDILFLCFGRLLALPIAEQRGQPSSQLTPASSRHPLTLGKEHVHVDSPESRKAKMCPECSFTTVHSKSLWRHIRNRHRGHRYKCQQCDKEYHYESGLKTHMETIHTKELDVCSACGLSMHRSRLKYHVQSVHHGTGNFTCQLCGKIFEKKSCYVGHVNKHFDVRQFQCENCGKTFFYETSLCGHRKSCLRQIVKKARKLTAVPSVFICEVCAKEFKTVCAMREHVQAKHSDNSYECVCGKSYSWRPSFKRHERKCKMLNETAETSRLGARVLHA